MGDGGGYTDNRRKGNNGRNYGTWSRLVGAPRRGERTGPLSATYGKSAKSFRTVLVATHLAEGTMVNCCFKWRCRKMIECGWRTLPSSLWSSMAGYGVYRVFRVTGFEGSSIWLQDSKRMREPGGANREF